MPEQRMSAQLVRLAKKRGRLPALVTALSLGLLIALQQFLSSLTSQLSTLGYTVGGASTLSASDIHELSAYNFAPTIEQTLFFILPLALGVFLSLWVVAPVSHELTLRFVLTRAMLASAAGVLLMLLARLVKGLVESVGAATPIYDGSVVPNLEPQPSGINFTVFAQNSLTALAGALNAFIYYTPVVLLAGVLLWLWLREHPRDYDVVGLVDEL